MTLHFLQHFPLSADLSFTLVRKLGGLEVVSERVFFHLPLLPAIAICGNWGQDSRKDQRQSIPGSIWTMWLPSPHHHSITQVSNQSAFSNPSDKNKVDVIISKTPAQNRKKDWLVVAYYWASVQTSLTWIPHILLLVSLSIQFLSKINCKLLFHQILSFPRKRSRAHGVDDDAMFINSSAILSPPNTTIHNVRQLMPTRYTSKKSSSDQPARKCISCHLNSEELINLAANMQVCSSVT